MKEVGVVTVGRSDYGIYLPLLARLREAPDFKLKLFVSGMHLSPQFGRTVDAIVRDGFSVAERVEMLLSSDTPEAIAKSVGLGVIGFAQAFARNRPDILVVLGDRFEMFAAALAALPFGIPLAHIHGGEITLGAIDDPLRHSITKLSHLHFVAAEEYRRRVIQLGEEPHRVFSVGAPALDHLRTMELWSKEELACRFGLDFEEPPLLVTFHPVTREFEHTEQHITEILAAVSQTNMPVIFTAPNADTNSHVISRAVRQYAETNPNARVVENFGTRGYFSVMDQALAMVGNSSSGIIEAASFSLPVVNIGSRQAGRVQARNVINCKCEREPIGAAIAQATSPEFKTSLRGLANPYGDGQAARRIVDVLRAISLDQESMAKPFYDVPVTIPRETGAH